MAVHEYAEAGHRTVEVDELEVVEVLYGCVCGDLTDVATGSVLVEARRAAKHAMAEHATRVLR